MPKTLRPNFLHGLGVGLLAFAALAAYSFVGVAGLALPAGIVGVAVLLAKPALALAAAIGAAVLVEGASDWGPSPLPSKIYDVLPGAKLTGIEALLLLALVATLIDRRARGRPILIPSPFGIPLGLLAVGLAAGAWTGRDGGAGIGDIVGAGRTMLPVLLVPLAVVQVVGQRTTLRHALAFAAVLAASKGVAGVLAYFGGFVSTSLGAKLTYYEAPANIVMLFFLCFAMVAILRRQAVPRWVWAAVPFVVLALTLSFRRSFWIAAVLGLAIALVLAGGRGGRRVGVLAAALAVAAVVVALVGGGSGQLSGAPTDAGGSFSLRGRLTSITPGAIAANREDRYRIGERRNVLAELTEEPIAGLGLGVGYTVRYPLSIGDITPEYVHFAALWWWMKLGILGLVGYLWLIGAAGMAGLAVWRRHPDDLVRAAGLAAAAAIVGYAVAETTATFSGADIRSSIALGGLLGLLSVAWTQTPAARDPGP